MTVINDLTARNADFAKRRFNAGLRINPSRQMMLVGCVDPRVDPAAILGVELGEAAVISNAGGMTALAAVPALLAEYFELAVGQLAAKAVSDPYASVKVDVDVLHAVPGLSPAFQVSGLVYEVTTGLIEVVVPPSPLRAT